MGWGPVNATCGDCEPCLKGQESYCSQIKLYGFDAYDRSGSLCSHAVRSEQWLFRIPDGLPSADAAPLMCEYNGPLPLSSARNTPIRPDRLMAARFRRRRNGVGGLD